MLSGNVCNDIPIAPSCLRAACKQNKKLILKNMMISNLKRCIITVAFIPTGVQHAAAYITAPLRSQTQASVDAGSALDLLGDPVLGQVRNEAEAGLYTHCKLRGSTHVTQLSELYRTARLGAGWRSVESTSLSIMTTTQNNSKYRSWSRTLVSSKDGKAVSPSCNSAFTLAYNN